MRIIGFRYVNREKSIAITHPELRKFILDKELMYKVSSGSNQKIEFICDRCEFHEPRFINNVVRTGFYNCPRCSDGFSYPEKYVLNVLIQTGITFQREKIFKWSNSKRYDFYIPSKNIIIEAHGEQHYKGNFNSLGGRNLEEETMNDIHKEKLALSNGITNYIVIDCRKSESNFIKTNLLDSELVNHLDLSDIDWLKCHEYACDSLVYICCQLWCEGIRNTSEIGNMLMIDRSTVALYLKQGVELGWCDYDPDEARRESASKLSRKYLARKVIQFSLEGEFVKEWESITDAIKELNIQGRGNIFLACNSIRNQAAGFQWIYKEDYESGKKLPKNIPPKEIVIKLTHDNQFVEEFSDASEAARSVGKEVSSAIYKCCRGIIKQSDGYKWVFKEDYLNDNYDKTVYTRKRVKPIIQLSEDGEYIKEWDGAYLVVEELGYSSGRISEACNGIRESAYGYKWVFKSDYNK